MLGLMLLLLSTFGLGYFYCKNTVDAIGLMPNRNRIVLFGGGFLFASILVLLNCLIESSIFFC
ncbi:MAG: hypothetical protein BGO88_08685 [Flavobacterium sp. 38-13]|nr:MAG: hypothetical protein BGO88_08685 [Flavobacterium sp. 38-13]